jgi:hypothetical protein
MGDTNRIEFRPKTAESSGDDPEGTVPGLAFARPLGKIGTRVGSFLLSLRLLL